MRSLPSAPDNFAVNQNAFNWVSPALTQAIWMLLWPADCQLSTGNLHLCTRVAKTPGSIFWTPSMLTARHLCCQPSTSGALRLHAPCCQVGPRQTFLPRQASTRASRPFCTLLSEGNMPLWLSCSTPRRSTHFSCHHKVCASISWRESWMSLAYSCRQVVPLPCPGRQCWDWSSLQLPYVRASSHSCKMRFCAHSVSGNMACCLQAWHASVAAHGNCYFP